MKMFKRFFAVAVLVFGVFVLAGCASHYEDLVGTWLWRTDGLYSYTFNADGTGERGYPETRETFTWSTAGSRLNINRDYVRTTPREIRNESWNFELRDGVLTLDSRNATNVSHSYIRDEAGRANILVREWTLDGAHGYRYQFNSDGTGTRGRSGDLQNFRWTTSNGRLNIFRDRAPVDEIRGEIWDFEIDYRALILTSRQTEDVEMRLTVVGDTPVVQQPDTNETTE